MTLTKADIVEKLAVAENISKKESFDLVETAFEMMRQVLDTGDNLKITRFGNFEVKNKNARKGRNPKTGVALTITPRRVLTFKPSALLKHALNEK